ncbi:MAG: hypothetical protein O3A18_14425 [Planctomycetota bacterium]|jgi:lipoate-protein ligase A|nr:hypothetical protein [Planctomycetota bacterium]
MAADELLAAEAATRGRPLVRFYNWSEPTLSLGGFQRLADARATSGVGGLALVRRPSGGGAILHGSDLTYAVAVPREHPWGASAQLLYDTFHAALVRLLRERGLAAAQHPGRESAAADQERLLCFDRRARGDVVIPAETADGHKILGSAQRRLRGAVVQHGSLLLRSPGPGLAAHHAGLDQLAAAAGTWEPRQLATAWLEAVAGSEESTGVVSGYVFESGSFLTARRDRLEAAAARFASPVWLGRR